MCMMRKDEPCQKLFSVGELRSHNSVFSSLLFFVCAFIQFSPLFFLNFPCYFWINTSHFPVSLFTLIPVFHQQEGMWPVENWSDTLQYDITALAYPHKGMEGCRDLLCLRQHESMFHQSIKKSPQIPNLPFVPANKAPTEVEKGNTNNDSKPQV